MKFKDIPGFLKVKLLYFLSSFEKAGYKTGWIKPDKHQLPDFLCIGAQKAGTTWLYENLRCHPEIFIPKERALHYFDNQFFRPLTFYTKYFEGQENKVKGEVMPGYGLLSLNRIKFIHRIMPNLKIIYIVRNPIDRAWSHARMSFAKFHNRPITSISDQEFIDHFQSELSISKGNYLKILSTWKKVFPKESFAIYFFEDIKENPDKFLNTVFNFLEVSPIQDFTPFKSKAIINQGIKNEIPEALLTFLKDFYVKDIYQMSREFGAPIDRWINRYYG